MSSSVRRKWVAKIKLRRGFVTEAHRWADELRSELDLAPHDPMCPKRLAHHLEVPIYPLSGLPACDEQKALLEKRQGYDFSAAACFQGHAAFILFNDGHDPKRQVSDIAHELAHILLGHPPANPFQPNGIRGFLPEHEMEAERLGPTLLVSDAAALRAYRLIRSNTFTLHSLSDEWNITREVIQMRINLSGAKKRLSRAA